MGDLVVMGDLVAPSTSESDLLHAFLPSQESSFV
jgi:hypothetical protein